MKRPIMSGSWRDYSTVDPRRIRDLWGGVPRNLAVDLGKSDLVVFDQDLELEQPDQVLTALYASQTLTLASMNRELPHWYFRQPTDRPIGNSVWAGGDVKGAGGYVVVSKHEAILDAEIKEVPPVLIISRAIADRRGTGRRLNVTDDKGPVDVGQVAKYLGISPATVQAVLDATRSR
jgi:hypothetical protein